MPLVLPSLAKAQEITEEEALRRLVQESPQARALRAQPEITRADAKTWSLAPNPTITYNREDSALTRDDFLMVQQSLPITGRRGLLRRAGSAAVEATSAESSHALVQLQSDLRLTFHELVLAQERKRLLDKGIAELQEVVRILQEREREGESSTFDRLRAERELADVQVELVSAQTSIVQARSRLASFFAPGTDPDSLVAKGQFAQDGSLPPVTELVIRALETRGDYRAEEHQLARWEFERRAARRTRVPEPILNAGLKRTRIPGFADSGYVVSLTIPLPLFNRGQAETARAQAVAEKIRAERLALRQQIEAEVKGTYAALELRRRLAQDYSRELGQKGTDLAQIAQLAYQEGAQGILELVDAYRIALHSQLRAVELSAAAKQAQIELDRAVGEEVLP
jgi:cobalt-zinc-cadmium efflux system outer membrane protein